MVDMHALVMKGNNPMFTNEDAIREANYRRCDLRQAAEKHRQMSLLKKTDLVHRSHAPRRLYALLAMIALPKS